MAAVVGVLRVDVKGAKGLVTIGEPLDPRELRKESCDAREAAAMRPLS